MKLTKFLLFATFPLIFETNSFAQDILTDQKSNLLFSVPSTLVTPKFSTNNIGATFPLIKLRQVQYFVGDTTNIPMDTSHTMLKTYQIFGGINVIENTKSTLIFTDKTNISPTIEIGFSSTLDKIQNPELKNWFYKTVTASIFLKYQRFTVYDKLTKAFPAGKYNGLNPGVKLGVNFFRKTYYALALTSSYSKMVDVDNLTSYQNISTSYFEDPNVASNGRVDGYLSPVSAEHIFRFSAALPIFSVHKFLFKKTFPTLQFVPTPFYFVTSTGLKKFSHNGGIALSVLTSRFYKGTNVKFENAFSLNYNILNSSDKSSPGAFYLSGSLNFGKVKIRPDKTVKE